MIKHLKISKDELDVDFEYDGEKYNALVHKKVGIAGFEKFVAFDLIKVNTMIDEPGPDEVLEALNKELTFIAEIEYFGG